MAFIRVKRAKRKKGKICEYAYICETRRYRKKRVKQKTKKYLGRVYRFEKVRDKDFYEFHLIEDPETYVMDSSKEKLFNDVIEWELINHGFSREKGIWRNKECFVDLEKKKIYNERGFSIALGFNEGFLTEYAIDRILGFKADSEEDGYGFAKMFVEAGLGIPKEIFVGIFSKVYK